MINQLIECDLLRIAESKEGDLVDLETVEYEDVDSWSFAISFAHTINQYFRKVFKTESPISWRILKFGRQDEYIRTRFAYFDMHIEYTFNPRFAYEIIKAKQLEEYLFSRIVYEVVMSVAERDHLNEPIKRF